VSPARVPVRERGGVRVRQVLPRPARAGQVRRCPGSDRGEGEGVGPGLERRRQAWGRRWDFFGGEQCDGGRRLGQPREMTKGEEYK
jgi:hypothetical protein